MSSNANTLGDYLRDRRARLSPAALGLAGPRRRTPGLRREEVAQRAHISAAWYTSLEQGRGGPPSPEVVERLARALSLSGVEREHLFLLALGRPPEVRLPPGAGVSPSLQRVLDAMEISPALVKTPAWDVVAWNRAALAVLSDYAAMAPAERNLLRRMFLDPEVRAAQADWLATARFVVAVFRADVARAGFSAEVAPLVAELSRLSPEFAALWREQEVSGYGEGVKRLRHPQAGEIAMEYSAFAVDGRPDLTLVVYNPATPADAALLRRLLAQRPA